MEEIHPHPFTINAILAKESFTHLYTYEREHAKGCSRQREGERETARARKRGKFIYAYVKGPQPLHVNGTVAPFIMARTGLMHGLIRAT